MKKIFSFLIISLFAIAAFSQTNDKMYKHDGETVDVKITKVGDVSIAYTYPNETAEQTISRYAVAKIVYGSGRTETITPKIVVTSESDWENVVILTDPAAVTGLKKGDEVHGKTSGLLSYQTFGSADKKATKKIREAAAAMGAPFILLSSEKSNQFTGQSVKKGIAYFYK